MRTLITLLFFLLGVYAFPQRNKQHLRFIYIDHEVTTPVNYLCKQLKDAWGDADENYKTEKLIIYLSTGLEADSFALISLKNIDEGSERETEDAFNKIIAALQTASRHTVLQKNDVDNIISLFNKYDFFDSDGNLALKGLTMDFYVGKDFLLREYSQKIIAVLNTVLNLYTQDANKLTINIRVPKADAIDYNKEKMFGDRNLQGINNSKYINLTKY